MPGDPTRAFASMGNYIFTADALREIIVADAEDEDSQHDLGGNIIPKLVAEQKAWVYDFGGNRVPGQTERERGYWRDVGSLDAYYAANMDLIAHVPVFDLYNRRWPILTWRFPYPPAKFVHDFDGRRGQALDSSVAAGVIVSGGTVRRSIVSIEARVNSGAEVTDSVLLDNVDIGRRAVVRRAILDKNVRVEPGAEVGIDLERDRERFTVSDGGVVVVAKDTVVTQ